MTNGVKIALILAVAIVLAASIVMYFSPYQTCVRARTANGDETAGAQVACSIYSK